MIYERRSKRYLKKRFVLLLFIFSSLSFVLMLSSPKKTVPAQSDYLRGYNFIGKAPTKAVLWIEPLDKWTFKLYNSDPGDKNNRCHWDQLSLWDDGYLRYIKTFHGCVAGRTSEIIYDPPIIFLPKDWNEKTGKWSISGSSNAKYYENRVLKCQGINNYTNRILGYEEITPNVQTVHWQTKQTTKWVTGDLANKCAPGNVTRWQEDYWLYAPKLSEKWIIKAIKRSKGGNLDDPKDRWDIWFE